MFSASNWVCPPMRSESSRLDPFPTFYPAEGVQVLDLEPRSLLQVLYFVSKAVDIPRAHVRQNIVRITADDRGQPFEWQQVTQDLFRVYSTEADKPPPSAHVAIKYLDHWFYIDKADHDSMSTFSLLMELARLELTGKAAAAPALTLPLSGR